MAISVKKIFDEDGRITGYKTSGTDMEFQIKMFIEEDTAVSMLRKAATLGNIEGNIDGLSNVRVKAVRNKNIITLLIPDENGKFPGDDGCSNEYEKQLD